MKDVCFNDPGLLSQELGRRGLAGEKWSVRRKLWGRLEGAALYGSSKETRILRSLRDAYHPRTGTIQGSRAQYLVKTDPFEAVRGHIDGSRYLRL